MNYYMFRSSNRRKDFLLTMAMYGYASYGEEVKRTLESGDVAWSSSGLRAVETIKS